jgi:uncharacterized membrane protein YkoI
MMMEQNNMLMGALVAAALCLTEASAALAAIDFADAQRIALERVPGQVESIELERGVFEVEVRTKDGVEYEVEIDAEEGSILSVRQDD